MPKYSYGPLNKAFGPELRLLRISKDPRTHQPQCSLLDYELLHCPNFIALSYTWGDPTPTHKIAVDREDLEVRQNLFDFLHAYTTEPWGMSGTGKPSFYWIDQICINQDDPIERSDQVRIMDKIYKKAKMVLIWLGCDSTMIEAARQLRDVEDDQRGAITTLLAHPYFSRIWVVQEIALSVSSPRVVCGGIELDLYQVRLAGVNPRSLPASAWATICGHGRFRKRRTLRECILLHCGSTCTDPRDKVYALLGLTPERWRVRVDYTKEVLEVYFDAVAALYEELFDLTDPECLYPKHLRDLASPRSYCTTLLFLGEAMGLPERSLPGLDTFLRYCLDVYLSTKIRNVQYTYSDRIYIRVRAQSSTGQFLAGKEIEVSWGSIKATRRKPLMRDIIPEMGLQLANATAASTAGQSGDSVPVLDRWWCKHDGDIHYFDGSDVSPISFSARPDSEQRQEVLHRRLIG